MAGPPRLTRPSPPWTPERDHLLDLYTAWVYALAVGALVVALVGG